jgi:hypothetical protein
MPNALLFAFATANRMPGEAFELVRVSSAGSYRVAYAHVRVLGRNQRPLIEARTDRYGRITFDLPAGTYDAEAKGRQEHLPVQDHDHRIETRHAD